jgi:hypothetical protein
MKGISRPRVESSVTQHDRHAQRLIVDLISQHDKIFQELKRQSGRKSRPESLDESHRRERYEARSRALSAAAKSPRIPPSDLTNGADKSPNPSKRVGGISGFLNRPHLHSLEPGDNLSLDGGLPAGGSNDVQPTDKPGSVEVTPTDESVARIGESPTKKPSLGRTTRVGASRPVGLQRHLKRESVQQPEPATTSTGVQDKDAAAAAANVGRNSESGRPFGVTLTDGPVRE